jgi:hypothetical protein
VSRIPYHTHNTEQKNQHEQRLAHDGIPREAGEIGSLGACFLVEFLHFLGRRHTP